MGGPLRFELAVSQPMYLSVEERELHAVLALTAHRAGPDATAAGRAAEVILVDCSGSMDTPPAKIAAARQATAAAIDVLRDGVLFAVVQGSHTATMVYPTEERFAVAGPKTRARARAAAARMVAGGGTAMGTWLSLADRLFAAEPAEIRHAVLLTDGQNLHETPQQLNEILVRCAGRFTCDARGIGDDWDRRELRRITEALGGRPDAVRSPGELTADFQAMLATAMGKMVGAARIRLRLTAPTRLLSIRQTYPVIVELTDAVEVVDERVREVSTGPWGPEKREYLVRLGVQGLAGEPGESLRAARVDLVVDGEPVAAPGAILVQWSDEPPAPTDLPSKLSRYAVQDELSRALVAGCDAYDRRDPDAALRWLLRASELADQLGHAEARTRLQRLMETDPQTGRVRLRAGVAAVDWYALDMVSSVSTLNPGDALPAHDAGEPRPQRTEDHVCSCGWVSPPTAARCTRCNTRFDAGAHA